MLHAKFQDHRTFGSGEEDFQRFSPYMGMSAILVKSINSKAIPFRIIQFANPKQYIDINILHLSNKANPC